MKRYWKPERFINSENEPRRVGFELEFGGLTVRETAEALQNNLGGDLQENNPFNMKLINSSVGKLKIERDAELLKSVSYREVLSKINVTFDPDTLGSEIEQGIDRLSSFLIPCEIVTEPLAFQDFPKLTSIVKVLNRLDVKGTQNSLFYAFGLHMNPSVPDLDIKTLVSYIQSFLLLADWIIEDSRIDFSRRFFTSFIDPFPDSYVEKVLDPKYKPLIVEFIDDYLEFNPTRNRALDMLPVLCEIDNDRVLAGVKKEERSLISGRPAFHYRLPDCRLGDKAWSLAGEWNRWWYVETISSDNQLRTDLIEQWNKYNKRFFMTRKKQWVEAVKNFLIRHITTPDSRS
jgi:hypothetical protein